MEAILFSYGLPGVMIFALSIAVKMLWTRNKKLQDDFISLIKDNTALTIETKNKLELNNQKTVEILLELKSLKRN